MVAVSIVVLNANDSPHLSPCLESVAAQSFTDFEVIVVDNDSSREYLERIARKFPDVKLVRLAANPGFAAANNLGAGMAQGRWLALLNNDTKPAPNWLEQLIAAAETTPEFSFFSSRLMQAEQPELIDSTGDVYHISGLAWHRDHNKPVDVVHMVADEVFSPCAAAALYDLHQFLQVGGFEEHLFSHLEDVDLGFRLRLKGYRCLYVPEAVVEHVGSASYGVESDFVIYQVQRNLVWVYLVNMPGWLFWKYFPAHFVANIILMLHYCLRGKMKAVIKAKFDAMVGIPQALRKRRNIQKNRRVTPAEIDRLLDHHWLSPFVLGRRGDTIRRLASFLRIDCP